MIPLLRTARTGASALRTALYGSIAAALATTDAHTLALVDAVLIGIVAADFSTWLLRALFMLPTEIWHGAYDGVVNLLFGLYFFRLGPLDTTYDGDAMASGFLVFLLVVAIKIAVYGVEFAEEFANDDL